MKYEQDEYGTWQVSGCLRACVEKSQLAILKDLEEEAQRQNQELLDSLIPSADDVRKAETEIQIIELLKEVKVV